MNIKQLLRRKKELEDALAVVINLRDRFITEGARFSSGYGITYGQSDKSEVPECSRPRQLADVKPVLAIIATQIKTLEAELDQLDDALQTAEKVVRGMLTQPMQSAPPELDD